jgi:hypothetical protein
VAYCRSTRNASFFGIQYVAMTLQVFADAAIKSAAWYSYYRLTCNKSLMNSPTSGPTLNR